VRLLLGGEDSPASFVLFGRSLVSQGRAELASASEGKPALDYASVSDEKRLVRWLKGFMDYFVSFQ
jgi:hypothetical protein